MSSLLDAIKGGANSKLKKASDRKLLEPKPAIDSGGTGAGAGRPSALGGMGGMMNIAAMAAKRAAERSQRMTAGDLTYK